MKLKKRLYAAIVTLALTAQAFGMNGVFTSAAPAVTQVQEEWKCTYDAGYQMGEWFLFIEGGIWKESLKEDAKVVFYNAKTKERVVYEKDKLVFDSIEGVYYEDATKAYITEYYRVKKGDQEALLNKDGTWFEENASWYDAVDVRGDCVIASTDGKQKILYKKDGQLQVLLDDLPENAEFYYQDGYYFLNQSKKLTIYNASLETCAEVDGYEMLEWHPKYMNTKHGFVVVKKEVKPGNGSRSSYVYNVIDLKGNLIFEDASSWYSNYYFGEDFIYDDYKDCLYKMDGLQQVIDSTKICSDLSEYVSQQGYEVFECFWDLENLCIFVTLRKENPQAQDEEDQYFFKHFLYVEGDGYSVPQEVYNDSSVYYAGYVIDEENNRIYNMQTQAETLIPEQYYFFVGMCFDKLAVYCTNRESWQYEKMYLLNPDGSMEEYEDSYGFYKTGEVSYDLLGLKKEGIWHWYMNNMENEVMQTEEMPNSSVLNQDKGYCLMMWERKAENSETVSGEAVAAKKKECAKLYDQYGNVILGEKEEYSVIGSTGVAYDIWQVGERFNDQGFIQDGYVLVADENQKYGLIALSVKYTVTGEVEIIVESEDAEFVVDSMEVNEVKEQENVDVVKAAIEQQLNEQLKKSADIKIYDISFYDSAGKLKEPDGKVKVTIDIPKDWDVTKDIRVYHIQEKGMAEDMKAECIDGKLVFETDHFSQYALVLAEEAVLAGDIDGDGSVTLSDAHLALKAALQVDVLDMQQKQAADMNADGQITLVDVQSILKCSLNITES